MVKISIFGFLTTILAPRSLFPCSPLLAPRSKLTYWPHPLKREMISTIVTEKKLLLDKVDFVVNGYVVNDLRNPCNLNKVASISGKGKKKVNGLMDVNVEDVDKELEVDDDTIALKQQPHCARGGYPWVRGQYRHGSGFQS